MRTVFERASGRAPGKIILFGEHAVVYGRSAIAAAIDAHVQVTIAPAAPQAGMSLACGDDAEALERAAHRAAELLGVRIAGALIRIDSDLHPRVGLGSSAALSVALIRALARSTRFALTEADVCRYAYDLETLFHRFPSGVDNTVATYGGIIAFRRGALPRRITVSNVIPIVVAIGTGERRTQDVVARLRCCWTVQPATYESIFDDIDAVAHAAEASLASGDLEAIGTLMTQNHELLRRAGISTDELDHMVHFARLRGAFGAKLTGGGGGGAIICAASAPDDLVRAFRRGGWQARRIQLAPTSRTDDAESSIHVDGANAAGD